MCWRLWCAYSVQIQWIHVISKRPEHSVWDNSSMRLQESKCKEHYAKLNQFFFQNLVWLHKWFELSITKTGLYNFDPLKPHFYIVKLGFPRVYINVLISAHKHRLWVLVRTASQRYPQSMFWAKLWKISEFLSENFHFLVANFSVYLNRVVFVMQCLR